MKDFGVFFWKERRNWEQLWGLPESYDNSWVTVRVLHPQISDLQHREQVLFMSATVHLQTTAAGAAALD